MRILQICTVFVTGGIQRHTLDLSEWLRLNGHDVFFAGSPGEWMNEAKDEAFTALDLISVGATGGHLYARIFSAVRSSIKIRKVLKRHRIELIHAHETAPALVARLATLGLKIPILMTYHGSEPERVPHVGRVGRLTAKRIITPSFRTAKDLQERGGVPKSKVSVIGLGVHPAATIETELVRQRRRELLGDDGNLLVVTIARLAPQKGIDILIDVVRRVSSRRKDIRFVVVGDGPLRDDVKRWSAEAGTESCLRFVGRSDEPYAYLKAADLFMLTSNWEALPITIVEAFRAGLPVIATDTGGVKELVDPSVGQVVHIADAKATTESVIEICENDSLRAELSANALSRSKECRFSPAHIHKILESTYADVLAESVNRG